jgi:hypothetical protein
MSNLIEKAVPKEFKVSWSIEGELLGAKVTFRNIVVADGVGVISETTLPEQSVSIGEQQGFPLESILDQIHIDALKRIEILESRFPESQSQLFSIPRWKGRAYLANKPRTDIQPLSQYNGNSLMEQIDSFMQSILSIVELEKFLGTSTWEKTDPMIAQMQTLLNLSSEELDVWFAEANAIV